MKRQSTEHRIQITEHRLQKNSLGSARPASRPPAVRRAGSEAGGFWVLGSKKGFTIVELMIAVTITILAMAGVYTSFIVQQRSFTAQDQVAETQVSSKIAFNLIANDIRNAGFGYPSDESPNINGYTSNITVGDSGTNGGSDTITLVGGFRQVATLAAPAVIGQNTITINYLVGAPPLDAVSNQNINIEGIDFAVISSCTTPVEGGDNCQDGTANPLILDRGVSKPFPAGRPVYLVEDITYLVSSQGLERNVGGSAPIEIANNIDDLQFAYAVDTDNDGLIDDQNANSAFDPDDYLASPPAAAKILAVRVSILASTAHEDPTLEPSTKPYFLSNIVLENNTTTDTDRFRRRIWSMEVAVRNPE